MTTTICDNGYIICVCKHRKDDHFEKGRGACSHRHCPCMEFRWHVFYSDDEPVVSTSKQTLDDASTYIIQRLDEIRKRGKIRI